MFGLPPSQMDIGCFTAAQRLSCHAMNADLINKPAAEGAQQAGAPGAKAGRSKSESAKPELAQVVTDVRTGRSYSKGKLLGKVLEYMIYDLMLSRSRRQRVDLCGENYTRCCRCV